MKIWEQIYFDEVNAICGTVGKERKHIFSGDEELIRIVERNVFQACKNIAVNLMERSENDISPFKKDTYKNMIQPVIAGMRNIAFYSVM